MRTGPGLPLPEPAILEIQPQVLPSGQTRRCGSEMPFWLSTATYLQGPRRGGKDGMAVRTVPPNPQPCTSQASSPSNNNERGCTSAFARLDPYRRGTCKLPPTPQQWDKLFSEGKCVAWLQRPACRPQRRGFSTVINLISLIRHDHVIPTRHATRH